MARWTMPTGGGLTGRIEYESGKAVGDSHWHIEQDERPFIEQAKLDREQSLYKKKDIGYKKFATIPDIVAIEIKEKHGIDIHAPETVGDKALMAKFMTIVKQDFSYLMSY